MNRFRSLARKLVEAAALGLLAAALLYLPPASVASRLDAWLFDAWSRIAPPAAPAQLVVVEADTLTELEKLAAAASAGGAELLVSTLRNAPEIQTSRQLGPVEVPAGERRAQRTDWLRGGHLWFEPDADGVLRRDVSLESRGGRLPSLAQSAAQFLGRDVATASAERSP